MKRLSMLAGMISLSSTVFGEVYSESSVGLSESTLVAGVEFEEREGESIPYSFHYPYQYDYYYPETGVEEEAVESSTEEAECPCKKKVPDKKKKKESRRRRPS
ncbi:hypothetical protein [Chlamydia suis]|uniref:hypothetical protein n=1 Tax=Chlamydia suis TaxID=83559 RepID=UPI000B422391|nr:hypothetical protein [Chlamydia suis]